METAALIASVVSVIIGGFAIWLSVTFYKMSSELTRETKDSAKAIGAVVERLETLFDRLYADTFSMMRETVTDMRKQLWPELGDEEDVAEVVERKTQEKYRALKEEMDDELSGVLERVGETDERLQDARAELERMIDHAVSESRRLEQEARTETVREIVLRTIQELTSHRSSFEAHELREELPGSISLVDLNKELFRLEAEGQIGIAYMDPGLIEPDTVIHAYFEE